VVGVGPLAGMHMWTSQIRDTVPEQRSLLISRGGVLDAI
jgi:hypothetical protein